MKSQRKTYSADFKAKVALEALRGDKTINEIASQYGLHPHQITQWKKLALDALPQLFSDKRARADRDEQVLKAQLYQQIGQLKFELDWLKKKLDGLIEAKRQMIEPEQSRITLGRQCELVGLARSSYYYQPACASEANLLLMHLIDQQYTRTPFFGVPRMTQWLRAQGYLINHKRIERLMRLMGLEAISPTPHASQAAAAHKVYPYLLKGVKVVRPNQVWCTDITYIGLRKGYVYLVAIMDWYSRYVLSWEVSNSLDVRFCLEALEKALLEASPEIFNSDQGSQFTCREFTSRLLAAQVEISMDGRGRVFDNIFIERRWRTIKSEEIYLKEDADVLSLIAGLEGDIGFYNHERLHQGLGYRTPEAVYTQAA